MSFFKKLNIIFIISSSILFVKCTKKNTLTGVANIDNEYKFESKENINIKNDSINSQIQSFHLSNNNDSIYIIENSKINGINKKSHGWANSLGKIGDWYYEKFTNNKILTDSIVNYIIDCNKPVINYVKIYNNKDLNKFKGYFHEINMNKNINVGDTLLINIDIFYDTLVFEKPLKTFLIFKPSKKGDFCEASDRVIDNFFIDDNKIEMNFIIDKKGNHTFYGFYYLPYKKQSIKDEVQVKQIFVEMNFNCS